MTCVDLLPQIIQEFNDDMQLLNNEDDCETRHHKMDMLMCETLVKLGGFKGVQIFLESCRYYA